MMGGDAGANDELAVFVIVDFGVIRGKLVEYFFSPGVAFWVGPLRFIHRDFRRRFVALSPCRQKNYRRKKIKSAQCGDQFVWKNVGGPRKHTCQG